MVFSEAKRLVDPVYRKMIPQIVMEMLGNTRRITPKIMEIALVIMKRTECSLVLLTMLLSGAMSLVSCCFSSLLILSSISLNLARSCILFSVGSLR